MSFLSFLVRPLAPALLALSLGQLVALAPLAAQEGAAPSATQLQLARDLVESNGSLRAVDEMVPAYLDQVRTMFTSTNPDLATQLTEVAAGLRPEFMARRSEVIDGIARAYATSFSEAELRELVGFYTSPTGKKFVAVLPVVLQESFQRMQAWSTKLSEEMVARVRAEMRKKGHEL